jgi:CRISPR-associated endonuclease/helicase Cas3
MEFSDFDNVYRALTGNLPFPWHQELYRRFVDGRIPSTCNIPTGLGKTSVIAIWLIALANYPDKMPRRLVYVVNRRTVVDQTTNEVENLRNNLEGAGLIDPLKKLCAIPSENEPPLAISTLRGQFADNREWSADPCRPAVICGTVDMIGSRLLFSGYRVGFKGKPLHAGFLGQDALLIHDEAHLEPAFQSLIEQIQTEQRERERVRDLPWPRFRVMALTATGRDRDANNNTLELTEEEKNPPPQIPNPPAKPVHVAWRRFSARKAISFIPTDDEKKERAEKIVGLADDKFKSSGRAILIFVQTVENVQKIVDKLTKAKREVRQLTGTLRGLERDQLPVDPVFARFLPPSNRPVGVTPTEGTVYLVCTSAGEVGVNISADHLVCDLTTFESMAQRFGRVNRFGDRDDTEIHVLRPKEFDDKDDYEQRRQKTLDLLELLHGDGSPAALGRLDAKARQDAFAPTPTIQPVTDILFDAWAMTTIREKLPGRPPVEPYLHGAEDQKNAETYIAWRQEVWELRREFATDTEREEFEDYAEDLLEDYALKPHELLRDSTYRKNTGVRDKLATIAGRNPEYPVWIQEPDGTMLVRALADLSKLLLAGRTVVLPLRAGGLMIEDSRSTGLFDASEFQPAYLHLYDVADEWFADKNKAVRCRIRVWDNDPDFDTKTAGMRLVRRIELPASSDDEDAESRSWYWYELPKSGDSEGSESSSIATTWKHHTDDVMTNAHLIAQALLKDRPDLQQALVLAARFHDLGKQRDLWQRGIGNDNFPCRCYAKSGRLPDGSRLRPRRLNDGYRHEFGSLLDVLDPVQNYYQELEALEKKWPGMKDLVLHLIAAHHGRGRPHFPMEEAFDPEAKGKDVNAVAPEVPRRFARLQRKYGRWGLAYLESLLRAADYAASINPSITEGNP